MVAAEMETHPHTRTHTHSLIIHSHFTVVGNSPSLRDSTLLASVGAS
jgi:hypothetical protein